jgi:hypothetical protein
MVIGRVGGQSARRRSRPAARSRRNPALIPQAIEELLRYEPPAPQTARYVTRDVQLARHSPTRQRRSQRRDLVITMDGYQITAEIVITYNVDDEGKLVALRAYWEMDRAAATARPVY